MAKSEIVKRHYNAIIQENNIPFDFLIKEFASMFGLEKDAKNRFTELLAESGSHGGVHIIAEEIEKFAGEIGYLPGEIFVANYPTGSFNAQVIKTIDGPLVLINRGATYLIMEIVKLFTCSTIELTEGPNLQKFSDANTVGYLSLLLYNYITQGDPRSQDKIPPLSGAHLVIAATIGTAATRFLIAHEYGHIVSGHLDNAFSVNATADRENVRFTQKSQEQEIEADIIAQLMCHRINFSKIGGTITSQEQLIKMQCAIAGSSCFFAIAHMLDMLFESITNKKMSSDSHPDSMQRLHYCNDVIKKMISGEDGEAFKMSSLFVNWLKKYQTPAINEIVQHLKNKITSV